MEVELAEPMHSCIAAAWLLLNCMHRTAPVAGPAPHASEPPCRHASAWHCHRKFTRASADQHKPQSAVLPGVLLHPTLPSLAWPGQEPWVV
jgi:hypothetical protein